MKRFSIISNNQNSSSRTNNILNNSSNLGIKNQLENNIIKIIKDMKNEIEKNNKMFEKTKKIFPLKEKIKKYSTSNLKLFF